MTGCAEGRRPLAESDRLVRGRRGEAGTRSGGPDGEGRLIHLRLLPGGQEGLPERSHAECERQQEHRRHRLA